ncbi:MAG TPA: peptide MFS transporter [Anaeromyxobacter sp.]|nr:peptide MFS transporter [Anaeromyxobacter sp.]
MTQPVPAVPAPPPRFDVLDDRSLLGHPRGLGLLFIVEMWERFSYYGMRAILVLYLVNALGWSGQRAAGLYGTYTSLVYLTPLVGGYLADRLIGTRRSMVAGSVIIALGHFCLALPSMAAFYLGLAFIIIGTGFFKPASATMVGQMYRPGDSRRDSGFTIYYMGVNLGALLGPVFCGPLAQRVAWHAGFALAGVGMLIGLIVYLVLRERYLPGIGLMPDGVLPAAALAGKAHTDARMLVHGTLGAVVGAAAAWGLGGLSLYPMLLGAAVGAAILITVLGTQGDERRRVFALFLAAFFVIFFWTAYEQAGSSMNLFADRHTDMGRVPSSVFQSLNPLMILILAPAFAALWGLLGKRGREPTTALKMVLGLFLLGVGFLFLVEGGRRADAGVLVSPWWLTLAYLFHTLGELCLSPVGLSYVSRIAPARFASLLMGAWYLANTIANKLAGALAGLTPLPGEAPPALEGGLVGYLQRLSQTNGGFFSIFVVTSFAGAVLMLIFVPLLNRLTRSVDGKRPQAA